VPAHSNRDSVSPEYVAFVQGAIDAQLLIEIELQEFARWAK
jgi:hypothetical protein